MQVEEQSSDNMFPPQSKHHYVLNQLWTDLKVLITTHYGQMLLRYDINLITFTAAFIN